MGSLTKKLKKKQKKYAAGNPFGNPFENPLGNPRINPMRAMGLGSSEDETNIKTLDYNKLAEEFVQEPVEPKAYSYGNFDEDKFFAEHNFDMKDYEAAFHSFVENNKGKEKLEIPSRIEGFPVNYLPAEALREQSYKWISFPSTLKYIAEEACWGMEELLEVKLPEGVVYIDRAAFSNCAKLEKVILPESLEYIGNYAFDECASLKTVKMPQELSVIRAYAFSETGIESIVIPNIEYLGNSCFYNCRKLEKVDFAGSVKYIGNGAFWNCINLTRVDLPEGLTEIYQNAFQDCKHLRLVSLPATLEKVGTAVSFGFEEEKTYFSFSNCSNLVAVLMKDKKIYNKVFHKDKQEFVFPVMPIFTGFKDYDKGLERYEVIKEILKEMKLQNRELSKYYIHYGNREKEAGFIGNAIKLYVDAIEQVSVNGVVQYNLAKALYLTHNREGAMKGLLFAINNVRRNKNRDLFFCFNSFWLNDKDESFLKWLQNPDSIEIAKLQSAQAISIGEKKLKDHFVVGILPDLKQMGVSVAQARSLLERNYNNGFEYGPYDDADMDEDLRVADIEQLVYDTNAETDLKKLLKERIVSKKFQEGNIEIKYKVDGSFNIKLEESFKELSPSLLLKRITEALSGDNLSSCSIEDGLILCEGIKSKHYTTIEEMDKLQEKHYIDEYSKAQENFKRDREKYSKVELLAKLVDMGVAAKRAGKYDEALDYYLEAVDIDSNSGNHYYAIGKLLFLKKQYQEATRAYTLAYVNNCSNGSNNIYRHCGFAYLASIDTYAEKFQEDLVNYGKGISGYSVFDCNDELENACELIGKAVVEALKVEYQKIIAES